MEECAWKTDVLIRKWNGDFRGIGLFEVLWKTVKSILHFRHTAAIQFQDTLLSFCMIRGTVTAYLEPKLLQQIMDVRQDVLYEIIMDLHKSYDSLDRNRCLNILAVYGVGTQTLYLLRKYWVRPTMVVQARGYFGTPFKGYHMVTPVDQLSPKIFNMVVDMVLQHWFNLAASTEEAVDPGVEDTKIFGQYFQRLASYFYT